MSVAPGRYQHFKGGEYIVLGVAKHSETKEELVVYRHAGGTELWARPREMFDEFIEVQGRAVQRFKYIGKE